LTLFGIILLSFNQLHTPPDTHTHTVSARQCARTDAGCANFLTLFGIILLSFNQLHTPPDTHTVVLIKPLCSRSQSGTRHCRRRKCWSCRRWDAVVHAG
jgi:hypothetical protein